MDRMILVVLSISLAYFAFDKFILDPARDLSRETAARQEGRTEAVVEQYGDKSIAVLPFADMSEAGDHQYLSDGLAEELLNLLAQVPELRVASRSSSFNLRDAGLSVPEMSAKLGVAHILEGSVRRHGDSLRVTVQLIEANSDTHLWSQNYDRTFDNIFVIQDDIASNVVDQLKTSLLGESPQSTQTDPEAYDLLLQAHFLINRLDPEDAPNVAELLERAVAIDPTIARAWLRLGDIYQRQVTFGQREEEAGLAESRAAIAMALQLEPDNPGGHRQLGWMAMRWDGDMLAARDHYQYAADLIDDPEDRIWAAYDYLNRINRWDIKLPLDEAYVEEHPASANGRRGLSDTYGNLGRFKEAIAEARAALLLSPNVWRGNYELAQWLLLDGQFEEALTVGRDLEFENWRLLTTALALVGLDRTTEAEAVFLEMREKELDWPAFWVVVEILRNDHDAAFEILNHLPASEFSVWSVASNITFQALHEDPRWQVFLERIGATPEDVERYQLDLRLPEDWPAS